MNDQVGINAQLSINDPLIQGLYLFKSLIKDGCQWHGDLISKKWSEVLDIPEGLDDQVTRTLSVYRDGIDFVRKGNSVFIA